MTLRIGILGAARVATYAMIDAAREIDGVSVAAVASRDLKKAQSYAAEHGIATAHEGYQALIDDPLIDCIYNALPPSLHALWSIRALEAGMPVLCEKPFALSVVDVEAMLVVEARTGLLLMEAQHSHYHPLSVRMREIVQGGTLGTLAHVAACFDATVSGYPDDIRFIPGVGGGALWDLGVYPAYWIRSATAEEPQLLSAFQKLADTGADLATTARMALPSGATAEISCNMAGDFAAWFRAEGTRGTLEVRNPLAPQHGAQLKLTIAGKETIEEFTRKSTYAFQLESFRDAVLHRTPVATRGEDSLATIRLLSAIRDIAVKE
jgi:predicted dehydrogenase